MASPSKAFIDPITISTSSDGPNRIKVPMANTHIYSLVGNRMSMPATLQDVYPRLTIVLPVIVPPKIRVNISNLVTFKDSIIKSVLVKTFPSGYHESTKIRPMEGQIYPRKRNKNY